MTVDRDEEEDADDPGSPTPGSDERRDGASDGGSEDGSTGEADVDPAGDGDRDDGGGHGEGEDDGSSDGASPTGVEGPDDEDAVARDRGPGGDGSAATERRPPRGRSGDGPAPSRHGEEAGAEEAGAEVDETAGAIVDEVLEHLDDPENRLFDEPVERRFVEERFFDFRHLEDPRLERYWVDRPFAYVTVHGDDGSPDLYHVSEPVLDDAERHVLSDLRAVTREDLVEAELEGIGPSAYEDRVIDVVADHADVLPSGSRHKIAYHLLRSFAGYGPIDPMMHDDRLEDVTGDGADLPIFVYHGDHGDLPTNVVLDGRELDGLVRRLAQRGGEMISFSDPIVSTTLPGNHRAQLTLDSDVTPRGSNFTIRLFRAVPFTPVELVANDTFSLEEMAFIWLCVEHRRSILFVGPTASGKTTSLNAASLFIQPFAKVVTIEQTRELSLPHDNWIAGVTREGPQRGVESEVTMGHLLNAALHQRPEYILVGEIRTQPDVLWTFLQSVFTGHAGATTFHATDVEETVNRFKAEPFGLPDAMIASIDLVSVQRQVRIGDQRVRRCGRIAELELDDDGRVEPNELFRRDPATDEHLEQDYLASSTLEDIRVENGWSEVALVDDLRRRRTFLDELLRRGVTDYQDVWRSLFAYRRDPEGVMAAIEDESFDPTAYDGRGRR